MKTQEERILTYLDDFGSITALEAVQDLGITQLSARLCGLQRKGYCFKKVRERGKNRYGEAVYYTRYSLEGAE